MKANKKKTPLPPHLPFPSPLSPFGSILNNKNFSSYLSKVGFWSTASSQGVTVAGKRQSNSNLVVSTSSSSIQDGMAPHMPDSSPRVTATPSPVSLNSSQKVACS